MTEGRVRLGMGLGSAGRDGGRDLSWLDATVVSDISREDRSGLGYGVKPRGSTASAAGLRGAPGGRGQVALVEAEAKRKEAELLEV